MSNSSIAPFVKWAGGKRQLIPQIKERMPEKYNDYYEPFVGGGAVAFELLPTNALINDINKALINAYKQICNAPEAFLRAVNKLDKEMWEDGKKYYYSLREHYNDKLMKAEYDVELAALFVFINKHCFNGLYRVNGKGLFNVPYNNSRRTSVDEEAIMATRTITKKAELKTSTAKPATEKEAPAKKTVTKKVTEKAATVKKTAVRKTSSRKTVSLNTEVYVQWLGKEVYERDIIENIKKVWTEEMGKKESELVDLKIYIKPEDNGAHYVINGDITGFIEL